MEERWKGQPQANLKRVWVCMQPKRDPALPKKKMRTGERVFIFFFFKILFLLLGENKTTKY
jgi:hypothetical protein